MNLDWLKKQFASRQTLIVCLLLALATAAAYLRVAVCEFTNYDERFMIVTNPAVQAGLTLRGILWAFTTRYFDYWHPLPWLSHMLDCELFGLHPGMHHLMNLAFHIANSLLVFIVLRRMSGAWQRSAVVAALFALHPLHVESVAWVAERKDTLSALFWLLCMWTYVRYIEEGRVQSPRSKVFYRWALFWFVCGLMSKPMVMTLPFVFLLMDYWPLRRLQLSTLDRRLLADVWRLTREKLPFFILTLASSAVSYLTVKAGGFILSAEAVPWSLRLANVPVSYVRYLWKTVWPTDLAPMYPMPAHWGLWEWGGSVLLLALISLLVVRRGRKSPYLVFGWLMFLGVLVPTIGLVQAGHQSIADRYTYIPSIGLFLAMVWWVADVSIGWKRRNAVLGVGTALGLMVCGWLTWVQVGYWRNSIALWTHCLAATRENAVAHHNLGHALQEAGRGTEAMKHYREAIRIKPDHQDATLNLGVLLSDGARLQEATNYFAKALEIKPDYDKAHINMAIALLQMKDHVGVTNHCARALAVKPDVRQAHCIYAFALFELGDFDGTIRMASEAIRLDQGDAKAFACRAKALAALGRSSEAVQDFATALNLSPAYADAHYHLGLEWLKLGRPDQAIVHLAEAVRLGLASADAHFQLGVALAHQGQPSEARSHYRRALELKPEFPAALNNLAWMLATHLEKEFRNGEEAVTLAKRACELTADEQTLFVGTLAAAYAEAGRFDQAIQTAQKTCALAQARGETNLLARNQELLRLFQDRRPYREGK